MSMAPHPRHNLARFRLRQALMWHLDRWVPYTHLIDVVWGNDPDGGPLMARGVLGIHIMNLRREGYRIESRHSYGWRLRHSPEAVDPKAAAWFKAHPPEPK